MRSRALLRFGLPLATLCTGVFGLYYVWWGVIAYQRGNLPFALFYAVYGLGGAVLALALWRVWRQLFPRRV